jgi:hypothetical protein
VRQETWVTGPNLRNRRGSYTAAPETILAGWAYRIRTGLCRLVGRFEPPHGGIKIRCFEQWDYDQKGLDFLCAKSVTVVERRRRSGDRAPPAFAPGRGFGGDREMPLPTERRIPMTLTDTQLVPLSAASQREDGGIELARNLKGGATTWWSASSWAKGRRRSCKASGPTPNHWCEQWRDAVYSVGGPAPTTKRYLRARNRLATVSCRWTSSVYAVPTTRRVLSPGSVASVLDSTVPPMCGRLDLSTRTSGQSGS